MQPSKRVPDVFNAVYFNALERGMDDSAAQWHAEMVLQQMAETPELPKEQSNDE